ncbi:hypothetical protein SAMN05518672_111123 [Chitinophaga sp. CF118]|uniref:hypothetical protein n=1 Tax=Chitinophaga sp. CF118 TaxID=1884367 RepID=UPI0008EE070B|nr:hypothetical protein [Chitinophaga sp. CF118]SFE87423.1 hypothetical protein SAMN05518672_111123 [Chitinophaga sp. CF118]
MPQLFNRIRSLTVKVYSATENVVIGNALRSITDNREHCNYKLIFDYLFFHILLLIPKALIGLYNQNTTDLLLMPVFLVLLLLGMLLLKKGVPYKTVSTFAVLSTMLVPMASSFLNNQDTSPRYTMIWLLSILFCYITTNLATTLLMGALLCGYLGLAVWVNVNQLAVFATPNYSAEQNIISMPILAGLYILFLIRVLGAHYRNIFIFEEALSLQKQKQHSSLLNQHLTKQFIILKGLSRSGKSKYLDGNRELLEACLGEIEKQCESAIDYLDAGRQPEN